MAVATIPVDLRNPGQVFACLGFMEAAEILCGPCTGRFDYQDSEIQTTFTLRNEGVEDPIAATVRFLAQAQVRAIVPKNSDLSARRWAVGEIKREDEEYPCPAPDSPATLPIELTDGRDVIPVDHWADDANSSGRDNVKFWAGAAGYPGAALARDALEPVAKLGDNALAAAIADPFALEAQQSSSFRFDWRRDYIAIDTGFAVNDHSDITMVGFPLVEIMAAIGVSHARPQRLDKLRYRYGVIGSGAKDVLLPPAFLRAALGCAQLPFPQRFFSMRLDWPGQEGQARCITDVTEEPAE